VQLRLAHGALETEQQTVVEVGRIVDAVLVEDEGVGEGADLEQPVPVGGVAGEARDLEAEDDAGVAEPDLGDERLEGLAIGAGGPGESEVAVDDDDALVGPAERDGALAKGVLAGCSRRSRRLGAAWTDGRRGRRRGGDGWR
jgi:hypothetical protein